jgi:hypothetical protein
MSIARLVIFGKWQNSNIYNYSIIFTTRLRFDSP